MRPQAPARWHRERADPRGLYGRAAGQSAREWVGGRRGDSYVASGEVARYCAGVAQLLLKLVAVTGEIERSLDVAGDGGESSTRAVLEDDPTAIFRLMCTLLLRKARLHAIAVLRANETGNVHSLAVQMRPVLECAGQVVLIFHNLMIERPDVARDRELPGVQRFSADEIQKQSEEWAVAPGG